MRPVARRATSRLKALRAATAGQGIEVSVEALLWLALMAVAFALRLGKLTAAPLSLEEAKAGFAIWQTAQSVPPDDWLGDLASALTAHAFKLTDGGETLLRLIPAILGSLAVAAIWLLRRTMGSGAALSSATLLAFSPLAVFISRSADSYAAGLAISVLIVWAAFTYIQRPQPGYLTLLAVLVGLAAATDAVAVTAVLALAAFLALQWSWKRDARVVGAFAAAAADRGLLAQALVAGTAAFGLAVTHLGTDVRGLSTPALEQWVAMFASASDGMPRRFYLDVLLGYELSLLLVGAGACLVLLRRWLRPGVAGGDIWQPFLLLWTAIAVAELALSSHRQSGQLLILLLPLALVSGTAIAGLVEQAPWRAVPNALPWLMSPIPLVVLALLRIGRWSVNGQFGSGADVALVLLALWVALALFLAVLIRMGPAAGAGGLLMALTLLAPITVHTLSALNFRGGAEYLVSGRLTPQASILSERVGSSPNGAAAIDATLVRALGWYFRDRPYAVVTSSLGPGAAMVVQPAGASVPAGYRTDGGPWRLAEGWYPSSFDMLGVWRWFLYRQPYGPVRTLDVVVLVGGQAR